MLLGGLAAGQSPSHQQQGLVAGVGDAVDGLGQHRGSPGEGEGHEFGDGYCEIGEEGGEDRLGSAAGRHGRQG